MFIIPTHLELCLVLLSFSYETIDISLTFQLDHDRMIVYMVPQLNHDQLLISLYLMIDIMMMKY